MRKICSVLICSLLFVFCQSGSDAPIETYTLKKGEFLISVTETGELEAVNSMMIYAPLISWRFGALKITQLVEDGKQVQSGEMVVKFDTAEIDKAIVDAKAELEIAEAELRKAQAKQQSQIEELTANLEIAKMDNRISQLRLQQAKFEAEIKRKEIELNLEKAGIALEKAQQEIENQKSINQQEISKLELKVQQVKTKLEEAEEALDKLTVTAPNPGIAIIERNWNTDEKFQVDDQPYSGWPMISLPDLSLMKAKAMINEVDIAKIDSGQTAVIKLDAYPDTSFRGHVSEVATLARNKDRDSKVKVFDVAILIDENDKKLMPGMTVRCQIVVDKIADTLFIPLEALFKKDNQSIVYVKNGGDFEPRPVTTGPENDDYVIIKNGLKVGDVVALTDPTVRVLDRQKKKASKAGKEPA